MQDKKSKGKVPSGSGISKPQVPVIKELYFCFNDISKCKTSKKNLAKNTRHKWHKKLVEVLFKFTEIFNDTPGKETLHAINHADYKKLTADINGFAYKFMLSRSHGILTNELSTETALVIYLGKFDDHH